MEADMKSAITLPSEFTHEMVTPIIDAQEKNPLNLAPMRPIVRSLATGDYSCVGMEDRLRIERKSLDDLLHCAGKDRKRFEAQLERLRAFEIGVLALETNWPALETGEWRSQMTSSAIQGTLLGIIADGTTVLFGDSHARLSRLVARLIYVAAKRQYRSTREMLKAVTSTEAVA
jgi:ERCC4-type nuclease